MILEIIVILQLIAGILPAGLGFFFYKKDPQVFLNQVLGISMSIMGLSIVIDAIALLSSNSALYRFTEYIIAFSLALGIGCFFLAGIVLIRGEEVKSLKFIVPVLLVSLMPGTVIFLIQSVNVQSVTVLGETILLANWGVIGIVLVLSVFVIFFFGSLFYFYTVYPDMEGEIKARLRFFLVGMIAIGVSAVVVNLMSLMINDPFLELLVTPIGTYGSVTLGSLVIIYGFIKHSAPSE
ncbi:MAG: hypothetical protein ACFFBD_08885 [Candidatus Hodarchaeota archaeon]